MKLYSCELFLLSASCINVGVHCQTDLFSLRCSALPINVLPERLMID